MTTLGWEREPTGVSDEPSSISLRVDPQVHQRRLELTRLMEEGIELCRRGAWERGVEHLAYIENNATHEPPGLVYSYLGYGVARTKGMLREGMKLCRHAVEVQFYEPENYFNLARTYMLRNNVRKAIMALNEGLKIDPQNRYLLGLLSEIDPRRQPVFPFLRRGNVLNRVVGQLRHRCLDGTGRG